MELVNAKRQNVTESHQTYSLLLDKQLSLKSRRKIYFTENDLTDTVAGLGMQATKNHDEILHVDIEFLDNRTDTLEK